jgi:glycosyltransferase involved in cell wall biosynthesis
MQPVTVAAVSVSPALGGSEWSLLDFAVRAPEHGITLGVLVPSEGPLAAHLRSAGVPVAVAAPPAEFLQLSQRTVPTLATVVHAVRGIHAWAGAIRRAAGALFDGMPDLLYSNGFKAHLACGLIRGPARVWHLREFPPPWTGPAWRLMAAALPDATIANSAATAAAWRSLAGHRLTAVPNGVDLDRFAPAHRTGWIHELLGLEPAARLIGMPAVFARWKGHFEVIAAFELAATRITNGHLVLVGGPIYDTAAERGYARELVRRVETARVPDGTPLRERIHFVRFQHAPWTLYPEFDLVVHYSIRPEPFGRVVAEAMACGVPVVAAGEGSPLELVEHGVSGWLVPPRNPAALAASLEGGLSASGAGMGVAARRRAEERLDVRACAAGIAKVLYCAARAAR